MREPVCVCVCGGGIPREQPYLEEIAIGLWHADRVGERRHQRGGKGVAAAVFPGTHVADRDLAADLAGWAVPGHLDARRRDHLDHVVRGDGCGTLAASRQVHAWSGVCVCVW